MQRLDLEKHVQAVLMSEVLALTYWAEGSSLLTSFWPLQLPVPGFVVDLLGLQEDAKVAMIVVIGRSPWPCSVLPLSG